MKTISLKRDFGRRVAAAAALVTAVGVITPMDAKGIEPSKGRVLFVVTSHDQIGKTGKTTGFYLSEVTHPWETLVEAGYEVDFVSPSGGKAPVDGFDLSDPANKRFWGDTAYRDRIEHTMTPSAVDPDRYVAIHFAGGHGAMWDLADNTAIASIAARIYEKGGVVSAVCHGPAGLVNIKLADGSFLVDGKRVNAFTNEEETAVHLSEVVPFLLETRLIERGAVFEKSGPWLPHVVADQRLVTGQNPQSAKAVGDAVLAELRKLEVIGRMTRYSVKPGAHEAFQRALADYVEKALDAGGNVHAEAHHERDDPSIMWLIERWENRRALVQFSSSPSSQQLATRAGALSKEKPANYDVTDLDPLSKEQWRQKARAGDRPLIVMLFVDSKQGTQGQFRATYRVALPEFRSEPGVVTYQLSQFVNDDAKFVTYEKFRSDEAFQYHLNFPPIRPVIDYLHTSIKQPPFENGLHFLIQFAPPAVETGGT